MCTEIFLDDHLYQTTNNFLDAFDIDPILDKSSIPCQFDLVGIVRFEDASPDHVLKYFSNSLYVTLGTLESCFSFSSIFGLS